MMAPRGHHTIDHGALELTRPVCLIPMGTESPSVGPQIAECQRVLEKSGLEYKVSLDAK